MPLVQTALEVRLQAPGCLVAVIGILGQQSENNV